MDPAEVNLSAIETRFQERRPFFVEGAELFNFGAGGGNTAFYSRRIGRAPQVPVGYALADVPGETRILGAAKVSGRTRSGWSVGHAERASPARGGALPDIDAEGDSLRGQAGGGAHEQLLRGPRAARSARRADGGGRPVHRGEPRPGRGAAAGAPALAPRTAAGWTFATSGTNRVWQLTGFVRGSHIRGDRRAITRTQLAQPFHYFQRPDQDEVRFDSTRTSLSGLSSEFQLSYRKGRHWRPTLLVGTITPGYDVNDMGFQYRGNRDDLQGTLAYTENRPGKTFRYYQLNGYTRGEWNYDGDHIYNNFQLIGLRPVPELLERRRVRWATTLPGSVDDRLTWGGPLARRPGNWRISAGFVSSDDRKEVAGARRPFYQSDDEGGYQVQVGRRPAAASPSAAVEPHAVARPGARARRRAVHHVDRRRGGGQHLRARATSCRSWTRPRWRWRRG